MPRHSGLCRIEVYPWCRTPRMYSSKQSETSCLDIEHDRNVPTATPYSVGKAQGDCARSTVGENVTLAQMLRAARAEFLGAFEHHQLPQPTPIQHY